MNTNLIEWDVKLISDYFNQFTHKKGLAAFMGEYMKSTIEDNVQDQALHYTLTESSAEQTNEMHIEYKDSISNYSNFVFNDS